MWQKLLQLHLKATDQLKLRKDPVIIAKLGAFTCQVIKAVIIAKQNNEDTRSAMRKCDEYTIDLAIPTKLEVVKSLPVRDLLAC